jgi:hypothetical protein
MKAAKRCAAMDYDATDGPSTDELGIGYCWPELGQREMNVGLALQLYWPEVDAHAQEVR